MTNQAMTSHTPQPPAGDDLDQRALDAAVDVAARNAGHNPSACAFGHGSLEGFVCDVTYREAHRPGTAHVIRTYLKALTQPVAGEVEVVAWRVKDYADGWMLCYSETQAEDQAENGNLIQELVTKPSYDALARQRDALQEAVNFVWRWTWYKEGNGTSDAERLDAIKHHPGIVALNKDDGGAA